jgi:hypothetical protein
MKGRVGGQPLFIKGGVSVFSKQFDYGYGHGRWRFHTKGNKDVNIFCGEIV